MNTTLKFILQLGLLSYLIFFPNMLPAQELDTQRLERDIDIAQSILAKLFGSEESAYMQIHHLRNSRFIASSPKESGIGYYVKGQGVVLQINTPTKKWMVGKIGGDSYVIDDQENDSDMETTAPEVTPKLDKEKIKKLMEEFFYKYADLIGQLKPEDKIILVYDESIDDPVTYTFPKGKENTAQIKIIGEIDRQSVADLKSGKLSEPDFVKKIVFHEVQIEKKNAFEFDIFSGILKTLFREGSSENVRCDEDVEFNYIDGFGVNYYLSLYTKHESDFHDLLGDEYNVYLRGRTIRIMNLPEDPSVTINAKKKKDIQEVKQYLDSLQEVESKKIKLALDEIEPKLQEYIIEYGRTLKALKPDEVLVINVRINQWVHPFDQEEEKEILMRLSVKKPVLTAYDNREISLEEAKTKVEITR
ncbi:MAG: hypothetical protein NW226_08710 [Microscillaceae bacterium]|nr:hypothetical protein [Microscillaceae bacterium]